MTTTTQLEIRSPLEAGSGTVGGPLFPVGLVVTGRPCLVVGGGPVAARKVRSLLRCGATVTMVAPDVGEALRLLLDDGAAEDHRDALVVLARPYQRGEAAGYRLVVTATGDPAVDAAVYEDAERAGVWVNSADDPANCSMVLPAVWRTGVVTVSVSTDGTSPALSAWLRNLVAEAIGPHIGELAALLGGVRRTLRDEGRRTDAVDWSAILEGPAPSLVAEGRIAEAEAAIRTGLGSTQLERS